MGKRDIIRPFAPDFVSAETLAYRLDCSRSTIDEYVRTGILPKPEAIGNLMRWDFEEVRALIKSHNNSLETQSVSIDPYFDGVLRAQAPQA